MRETLIVIGLVVLAVALRSSRVNLWRKIGALILLGASFSLFYFLTDNFTMGLFGVLLWFFLPWFELVTRVRKMRLPLDNRLRHRQVPNPSFFPNASEAAAGMEDAGFEHISDCGWEWAGMQQFFRLYSSMPSAKFSRSSRSLIYISHGLPEVSIMSMPHELPAGD